jgi:hypothetical protein
VAESAADWQSRLRYRANLEFCCWMNRLSVKTHTRGTTFSIAFGITSMGVVRLCSRPMINYSFARSRIELST